MSCGYAVDYPEVGLTPTCCRLLCRPRQYQLHPPTEVLELEEVAKYKHGSTLVGVF